MEASETELTSNNMERGYREHDHMSLEEVSYLSTPAKSEKEEFRRKYTKIILIVMDVIYILLIPISLLVISLTLTTLLTTLALPVAAGSNPLMSGMLIRNMTSANIGTYVAIFSLIALPVVLLLSIIVPWILYYFKMFRTSLIVLSLPVVNLILLFSTFLNSLLSSFTQ